MSDTEPGYVWAVQRPFKEPSHDAVWVGMSRDAEPMYVERRKDLTGFFHKADAQKWMEKAFRTLKRFPHHQEHFRIVSTPEEGL